MFTPPIGFLSASSPPWFDASLVSRFNPADLASWVTAAQVNDSSTITNNNVVQPTVANQPNLSDTAYKGNRVARFDGTNDFYTYGVPSLGGTRLFANNTDQWTVFVVASGTTQGYFIGKAGATAGNRQFGFYLDAGTIKFVCRGTITDVVSGYTDGTAVVLYANWNGTSLQLGFMLNNQTSLTIVTSSGGVGASAEETAQNIVYGARTGGTAFYLNGWVGESLIYKISLSAAKVNTIVAYYADQWVSRKPDARFFPIGASNEIRTFIDLGGFAKMINIIGVNYSKNIVMDILATNGYTTNDIKTNIDAKLATMNNASVDGFPTYAWVHAMGNDVTNTRPYSTLTQLQKDNLISETQYIQNALTAKGYVPILADISFRHYNMTVIPNVNEQDGSLPYNENLVRPINSPNWKFSDNSESFIQLYTIYKNNYLTYLDSDGIHFSQPLGRDAYRQEISDTVGRKAFLGLDPVRIT